MSTEPTASEALTATLRSGGHLVRFTPSLAELNARKFIRRRRIVDNVLRWGTPILLFCVWQIAAVNGLIDRRFWPAPSDIFSEAVTLVRDGSLQNAVVASIRRVAIGYSLGCASGVFVGLLLGTVRPLRIALEPIVHALYTVPKLALLPLLLLIFGIGESPVIILIAVTVFFLVAIATTAAALSVPETYLETSRSFGASRTRLFSDVVVPSTLPAVVVSLRLSAGIAILVVVGVEFVNGSSGLGFLIWNSWQLFLAPRMYVGIVVVAVLGALFQSLIAAIGRRLAPWANTNAMVEI
jgi:ABC-type nitrate/sulfonate/bicarbonate transport system permease component